MGRTPYSFVSTTANEFQYTGANEGLLTTVEPKILQGVFLNTKSLIYCLNQSLGLIRASSGNDRDRYFLVYSTGVDTLKWGGKVGIRRLLNLFDLGGVCTKNGGSTPLQ